jgi:ribonuclease HII
MKKPSWRLVKAHAAPGEWVIGIDEVGRGAWAGPVAAAAVLMKVGDKCPGVYDSKLLDHPRRVVLDRQIRRITSGVGVGWASSWEVDQFGLSWAVRQAGLRALAELENDGLVILDGKWNYLKNDRRSIVIVKADTHVLPVAAASVVAKVARDRYMERMERGANLYGFSTNRGYITAEHKQAVRELGFGPFHRRRWTTNFMETLGYVDN